MKKGAILFFAVCLSMMFGGIGCTDKKPVADTTAIDSVADTVTSDTLSQLISEEQQMPKAADELFDDFIFNFAGSRKLQIKRIAFPLKIVDGTQVILIDKNKWRMERFFMRQGFYTLIFDNQRQMKVVKDTSINSVVVEKINLKRQKVKKYLFERINGKWMLTSIENNAAYNKTNSSFLMFYQKFATDSVFQLEHLHNPISFSGPDPDNDFGTMTGEIEPETWPAFAPQLPSGLIYNIMYGQKYSEGKQKIFVMRGISNGMEMELTFKQIGRRWVLTKLSE